MQRPFRLSPPPAREDALLRPRLLTVLARRFDLRLITLEAGAGLGKTTLLSHAVNENRLAPVGRDCWLTCEAADSSASTLLGALLEGLGVSADGDAPSVEQVCEAVWSCTPEHVCLIVDDAHHVDEGSPGESALRQLLDGLPENGHLVVAGRRLPSLARSRLTLHGRAADITESDLRLDASETVAFADAHGVSADVVREAAGWPALAELYARAGRVVAGQFVSEEVLDLLPQRERDAFLLVVAVGGVDADALDAVTGSPFDHNQVAELPLVQTDEQGGLHPHAIWGELLADQVDLAAATEARRRVATVLLGRGDHGLAFDLLAAAEDWDHALPAVFAACNDQVRPPWPDQMERWRALIPESLADEPEVVYLDAMIHRSGDLWSEQTNALFARAVDEFHQRGSIVAELTASVRWAYLAWVRADRNTLDRMYARGREVMAAGFPVELVLVMNRAIMADLDGRVDDLLDLLPATGDGLEPRLRHFVPLLRVFAQLAAGDAGAAVDDAEHAMSFAAPVVPAAGTGWAVFTPALVRWACGDVAGVCAAPPGDPGARFPLSERVPAMALGAVVSAHLGDDIGARARLDEIDAHVPELGDRHLLAGFRAIAGAAIAVAVGDEEGARAALHSALDGRPIEPAGAGRALVWVPSLAYLLHDGARTFIDTLPAGSSRQRALNACRALLEARTTKSAVPVEVFEDPVALLTVLPGTLATELIVRAAIDGPSASHVGAIAGLADVVPKPVRATLRRFAESDDARLASAAQALLGTVPIPPSHHVRIEVLGPVRLLHDGHVVDEPDWRRQRVRQLVCALVGLREVRRSRLGTLLWPEFDEKAVSANLRMTLNYVQALLEPERSRGDAPWFLRQAAGSLALRVDEHLSVDAWEFERELDAAEAAKTTPSVELRHLLAATGLWRGEPLDDVAGEEWADPLRERLRQRFVRAAVRAGDLLVATARFAEAIALADRALEADPWCEAAIRLRVAGLLAAGDPAGARQAFESGRRVLADLGVSLEPATEELGRRVWRERR